jgi:hypothetical protein
MSLEGSRSMKYRIEISAENSVKLAEMLTKLAAHVIRDGAAKPDEAKDAVLEASKRGCGAIKILDDNGAVIASLAPSPDGLRQLEQVKH